MAVTRRRLTPKPPPLDTIDRAGVAVDYDPTEDTLFVNLFGAPRPAVSVYVDDDTIYRVDPISANVVGIESENFLARFLRDPASNDQAP